MKSLDKVRKVISRITASVFEKTFKIVAEEDKVHGGRVYLQVQYTAPCNQTGELQEWHGGKHYLSEYMTEDEIVKKAWVAFEQAVKHEVMEGFKVDGIIVTSAHSEDSMIRLASDEEVINFLIGEVKSNYKVGDSFYCLQTNAVCEIKQLSDFYNVCNSKTSIWCDDVWASIDISNGLIYKDGKFADKVETITRKEAEKQLGKKIID
ncbi:MAG: hypothetical protein KDH96_06935 [Candidatus Riesia sp.]|nr:hypothetical protein [Candidatus Riesia sp.]